MPLQRSGAALTAGTLAIAANTAALQAANLVPLETAKGGLLRLLAPLAAPVLSASGLATAWHGVGAPAPGTWLFQTGFHIVVGLGMAVFYAYALWPVLPGRPWTKGLVYAIAVWALNAALLLPATGEGFAGSAHLTFAGMTWFAAAHTVAFVLLAVLFDAFVGRTTFRRVT